MSESPAATIRRAAALMRERAQAATPGPWDHMCLGSEGCLVLRATGTIRERGHGRVARFGQKDWQADHADAEFVSAMSPLVALAVADWLDAAAQAWDEGMEWDEALLVACAYLNEAGPAEEAGIEAVKRAGRAAWEKFHGADVPG